MTLISGPRNMTDLLSCSTLYFRNRRRHFKITDGRGGLLAVSRPLPGSEGLTLSDRMFKGLGDFAPATLEILDSSGKPRLLMERPGAPDGPVRLPSIVKTMDGSELGRIVYDDRITIDTRSRVKKEFDRELFLDGEGNTLGTMDWAPIYPSNNGGSFYCDYFGADGIKFGRFRSGIIWGFGPSRLRFEHQPPEPLNTLARLSPIAFQFVRIIG